MDTNFRSNVCRFSEREATVRYREQRSTMLHLSQLDRRERRRRGGLRPYQRQLALLREAYRYTLEAIAWQEYADTWYTAQ